MRSTNKLLIIAAVCLSLAAAQTVKFSGQIEKEGKVVGVREKTYSGFKDDQGNAMVIQDGDVLITETTYTDGKAAGVEMVFEDQPVTQIVNGKIVVTHKKVAVMKDTHLSVKKVSRTTKQTVVVNSVTDLINTFGKVVGDLTDADYQKFSSIATTDDNNFSSDYNYWEVKDMDLAPALTKLLAAYKTPVTQALINSIAKEITDCEKGYVELETDTSNIDINNQDGWTINYQYFAATCSKDSDLNKLFAWSGSKQGIYIPGAFSMGNAQTISSIVKRWLQIHIPLLTSCTSSPVQEMEVWNSKASNSK